MPSDYDDDDDDKDDDDNDEDDYQFLNLERVHGPGIGSVEFE